MSADDDGDAPDPRSTCASACTATNSKCASDPSNGKLRWGLLTDLAALRLVASRTFGPVGITTRSLGALATGRRVSATGETGSAWDRSVFRAETLRRSIGPRLALPM